MALLPGPAFSDPEHRLHAQDARGQENHCLAYLRMRFTTMSPWLHFFQTFYFDIIVGLEKSCKISTKISYTPFTQIPQMLTVYRLLFLLSFSCLLSPFLSHLRISCKEYLTLKYFSVCFLKTWLFSYITTVQ